MANFQEDRSEHAPSGGPAPSTMSNQEPELEEYEPTKDESDATRWRVLQGWYQHIANTDHLGNLPRIPEDISSALDHLTDTVWYYRSYLHTRAKGPNSTTPEIWNAAEKAATEIEARLGKKNLGPFTDFEWGMINGKLSALRWVFGDEWDHLDT